jgi:membrane-bound lytic murein transglycosylase D
MKNHLKENGVPEDLVYLALIESGFNLYAYSRAKASGPWQFISLTGKRYGLQANWWVDERRDPEKSTIAAARYLKDLYNIFECWYLAVAGYNAGETKIATAVKRYGTEDFWELTKYQDLKQETKDYVPQIIAAAVIAGDPVQYGFIGVEYEEPLCYEKVPVPGATDLRLIARACKINIEDLQSLNPELLRGFTPPNASDYEVKIPCGSKKLFLNNFEALRPLKSFQFKTHVVKKGDTLSQIAKSYRVKVAPIQEINHLKKATNLSVGMNLLIPVPMSEGGSSNPVGKKELNGKKENREKKVS